MASVICSGCILKSDCEKLYKKTNRTDCYFFPNKRLENYTLNLVPHASLIANQSSSLNV